MTIKWGDPIECNGVRPDWLRDDEQRIAFQDPHGDWYGGMSNAPWFARELDIEQPQHIRLPADHPAYVALARGFTPWGGGESAPDDWDATQPVLLRNAIEMTASPMSWRHPWNGSEEHAYHDIIGYRKRNTRFDEPHLARIEVEGSAPVEGVFIKRMTEAEATDFANKVAFDGLGHTAPSYAAWGVHACLKALGLIRPESRAERFTRETGHAVTEAVEAALNWKDTQA